jgi:hypothetical protein
MLKKDFVISFALAQVFIGWNYYLVTFGLGLVSWLVVCLGLEVAAWSGLAWLVVKVGGGYGVEVA